MSQYGGPGPARQAIGARRVPARSRSLALVHHVVRALAVAAICATGCGDGGVSLGISGCSESESQPFETTARNTTQKGVVTRVTSTGVDFLLAARETLVGLLLDVGSDGWVELALPDQSFGDMDGIGVGIRDVVVGFDLRSADLRIEFLGDPARIHIDVRQARLAVRNHDAVVWGSVGGDFACRLVNGIEQGSPREAFLDADFALDLFIEVDGDANLNIRVEVLPFEVHGIDIELVQDDTLPECNDGAFDSECGIACGLTDVALEVVQRLYTALQGQLDGLVQPAINGLVNGFLSDINGRPLAIEGAMPASALAGVIPVAGDAHALAFRSGPSADGFVIEADAGGGSGLELTLDVGLDTISHPCVPPPISHPEFPVGPSPTLSGVDHGTTPYHVGLSLAQAVVNRLFWNAYQAGTLCVALDSDRIEELLGQHIDTGALAALLPGLPELTSGPKPVLITLDPRFVPSDLPLVGFEAVPDAGGVPRARMRLSLPHLGISFYAQVEERWARIFQGNLSVALSLEVQATPDNHLMIAVGAPEISDLAQVYNELLDAANIPEILDLVANLLTSVLLTEGLEIDLAIDGLISQISGLPIDMRILALRTDGSQADFLSVLLALATAPPGRSLRASVETRADVAAFDGRAGRAALRVDVIGADTALYQWRVDRGPWRPLVAVDNGVLDVDDALLKVLGPHTLHVRAVAADDYRTLDSSPAALMVETTLTRGSPPAGTRDAGGCSTGSGPAPTAVLGLWMLMLALVRRRRLGLVLVFALSLGCDDRKESRPSDCDAKADCPANLTCVEHRCVRTPGCDTTKDCCPGAICEGGQCVVAATECESNDACRDKTRNCVDGLCTRLACPTGACPSGAQCIAEHCHDRPPCNGQCPAGEVCFPHLDQCRPAGDVCATSCPEGFAPYVLDASEFTGADCRLEGFECECERAPPLTPADFGRHASMGLWQGEPVFAAYDADFGDLVFVTNVEAGSAEVTYLDGAPSDGPIQADPSGPRGGRTAPGPDRGRYASLEVDAIGRIHIAYYDATDGSLRYIWRDTEQLWRPSIIVDAVGDAGRYARIAVDGDGRPHIVYYAAQAPLQSGLRYAVAGRAEPGEGDFATFDVSGRPAGPDDDIAPEVGLIPDGHGLMPCMRLGGDGRVHVAFYDGTQRWMYLAAGDALGFEVAPLRPDPGPLWPDDPGGRFAALADHDLGQSCDLVLTSDGVSVIFTDADANALLAYRGPIDGGGGLELVDPGGRGIRRFIGGNTSQAVDGEGRPFAVYQDATDNDLLITVRDDTSGWSEAPIALATVGALGYYNTVRVDDLEAVVGTLELKTLPGGRGAHRLHVFRTAVPRF